MNGYTLALTSFTLQAELIAKTKRVYMLGGGFLGQAHQTSKQNRELIKSVLRRPAALPTYNKSERSPDLRLSVSKISEKEMLHWQTVLKRQRSQERIRKVLVWILVLVIMAILFFVFYAEVVPFVKRWFRIP